MQNVSISLARLLGGIGFLGAGLGALCGGNSIFRLNIDFAGGFGNFGAKGWALSVGSVIVELIGMSIGLGITAQVKVEREETDFVIANIWHYSACGFLSWSFLMLMALNVIFGKDEAKEFLNQYGMMQTCWELAIIGIVGSVLMAIWLMVTGVLRFNRSKSLGAITLAIPIGLGRGYYHYYLLGLNSSGWIFLEYCRR